VAGFWWYITRVYRVKKKQGFGLMEEEKNRKIEKVKGKYLQGLKKLI